MTEKTDDQIIMYLIYANLAILAAVCVFYWSGHQGQVLDTRSLVNKTTITSSMSLTYLLRLAL